MTKLFLPFSLLLALCPAVYGMGSGIGDHESSDARTLGLSMINTSRLDPRSALSRMIREHGIGGHESSGAEALGLSADVGYPMTTEDVAALPRTKTTAPVTTSRLDPRSIPSQIVRKHNIEEYESSDTETLGFSPDDDYSTTTEDVAALPRTKTTASVTTSRLDPQSALNRMIQEQKREEKRREREEKPTDRELAIYALSKTKDQVLRMWLLEHLDRLAPYTVIADGSDRWTLFMYAAYFGNVEFMHTVLTSEKIGTLINPRNRHSALAIAIAMDRDPVYNPDDKNAPLKNEALALGQEKVFPSVDNVGFREGNAQLREKETQTIIAKVNAYIGKHGLNTVFGLSEV